MKKFLFAVGKEGCNLDTFSSKPFTVRCQKKINFQLFFSSLAWIKLKSQSRNLKIFKKNHDFAVVATGSLTPSIPTPAIVQRLWLHPFREEGRGQC